MVKKTRYSLFILLLAATTANASPWGKHKWNKETPIPVQFPTEQLPLPIADYSITPPPSPEIARIHPPKREITVDFSIREQSYIGINNPDLFKEGNTELINLNSLSEHEYAFPLPGGKVISPYGGRRKGHSGADIKTVPNDTIVAAFDGVVRMSKSFAAYGKVIVIRHANGLETVYSHNSKNLVHSGDFVRAGQAIGLTGRTGRATTEHLHFEVRVNGTHVNPNLIFNMEERTLKRKTLVCKRKGNGVNVKTSDVLPHQLADVYKNNDRPKRAEQDI